MAQFIEDGDCESLTVPHLVGQTANLKLCTFARDSSRAHSGSYSYKYTHFGDLGEYGQAFLTSARTTGDLNGLTPGSSYRYSAFIYTSDVLYPWQVELLLTYYIPGNGGFYYESQGGEEQIPAGTWTKVSFVFDIPLAASAAWVSIRTSCLDIETSFYLDDISLEEGVWVRPGTLQGSGIVRDPSVIHLGEVCLKGCGTVRSPTVVAVQCPVVTVGLLRAEGSVRIAYPEGFDTTNRGFTNTFGVATDLGEGHYTTVTYHTEYGRDPAYSALFNASISVWVADHGTRAPRTWSAWRECYKCGLEFPENRMVEYEGMWYCSDCIEGVPEQDDIEEFESMEDDSG